MGNRQEEDALAMERRTRSSGGGWQDDDSDDLEVMGWRSFWLVRWGRTTIYNPLMAILRRQHIDSWILSCFVASLRGLKKNLLAFLCTFGITCSLSIRLWPSTIRLWPSCAGNTLIPGYFLALLLGSVVLKKNLLAFLGTFGITYLLSICVYFDRGTEPKQLAMSAALGITLGVFPIYGITVFLCGLAVAILGGKCHAPTLMLGNLLATPLEFSMMIPFLRVGETLVGADPYVLSKDALWQALTGKASSALLLAIAHALLGWLVAGPFLFLALYIVLLPIMRWAQQQFGGQERLPSERVVLLNEEVLLGKKEIGE